MGTAQVMKVFRDFDTDHSGWIEDSEMPALCATMGIDPPSSEQTDTLVKDGKVDTREFFMFYTGCSNAEAHAAFSKHGLLFATLQMRPVETWSSEEVEAVMAIFKQFDADNSGFIDKVELSDLCEVLMIKTPTERQFDKLVKDGKIDRQEFFMFYTSCSMDEAKLAFEQHAGLLGPSPAPAVPALPVAKADAGGEVDVAKTGRRRLG